MSMPKIPEEPFRPSLSEVTIDIIKAVALEETAISRILNAEAERLYALVQKYKCCQCSIGTSELNESLKLSEKILSDLIMKEWMLLKQMEAVFDFNYQNNPKNNCDKVSTVDRHKYFPCKYR